MRIIGPWDRGSQPRIQRVLEGRQVFATEFSRVDTACPAHIIVETYFRECNVYFRTISQRLAAPIHRLLKGQPAFSQLSFRGWVPSGWLILLLKHTSMNIMCILEPLDGGQQPPIQLVGESRQFFGVELSEVGTIWLAHIIVDIYSLEYNSYSRAIGERLAAPTHRVHKGQPAFLFVVEFSRVSTACAAHIIVETHSQEYNVHFRIMREMLATPDPESRKIFEVEFSGVAMA